MRQKTVTRYFCDFCSKGMFKRPAMARHERGCTRNENRVCYLCEQSRDYSALVAMLRLSPMGEWPDGHESKDPLGITPATFKKLREQLDGCPSCTLSALRIAGLHAFGMFDYKRELAVWHQEQSYDGIS